MSDSLDDDKTGRALENLEPWAREEISRLDKQFHAQGSPDPRGTKRSKLAKFRITGFKYGFLIGLICGLLIAVLASLLLLPKINPQTGYCRYTYAFGSARMPGPINDDCSYD